GMVGRLGAAGLPPGKPVPHNEVLHFPSELRGERRRVEAGDARDAGTASEDAVPCRSYADADGRHDTESGDDDAARHQRLERMIAMSFEDRIANGTSAMS